MCSLVSRFCSVAARITQSSERRRHFCSVPEHWGNVEALARPSIRPSDENWMFPLCVFSQRPKTSTPTCTSSSCKDADWPLWSYTFWVSSPRSRFGLDFLCPSSLASLRHLKRSVGGILGVFLGELFQAAEVTGFRNSHFITEWDSLSLKTRRFPLSRVSSCVTG